MTRYAYPTSAMLGDYARAAAGFVPTVAMLAAIPLGPTAAIVLGAFVSLFGVFGIRTALRHATHVEMTDTTLSTSGVLSVSISWSDLDRLKISYYSTRRDRRGGWMQLELGAGPSRLRLDSRIEGFIELIRASVRAAEMRGLAFDLATSTNLEALGIKLRAPEPSWEEAAGGAV